VILHHSTHPTIPNMEAKRTNRPHIVSAPNQRPRESIHMGTRQHLPHPRNPSKQPTTLESTMKHEKPTEPALSVPPEPFPRPSPSPRSAIPANPPTCAPNPAKQGPQARKHIPASSQLHILISMPSLPTSALRASAMPSPLPTPRRPICADPKTSPVIYPVT
jgi:hypothetical protein